jgi:peptidoglycan/LPS O-acetylase OafA/YrhL
MKETKESLYLPNLNGIRFMAAIMVLIHQLEYTKKELGLNKIWTQNGLGYLGDLGVILFFTLSGFLITYLLLIEKHKTGVINIKSFYVRRILRIWPLYYFIILLFYYFDCFISFTKN